jgi:hypothetical protein
MILYENDKKWLKKFFTQFKQFSFNYVSIVFANNFLEVNHGIA